MYDVLGIGCCALDIVMEVPHAPAPDEKVRAERLRIQGGGLVATALVAVARLGGRCAFLGALGDDVLAQRCFDELRREGVDVSHVRRVPGASVLTAVIAADRTAGTRMILWTDEEQPPTAPEQVTEDLVRASRVLHIDNFQVEAALQAAAMARRLGVPVTVDLEPGGRPADELLRLVDYAIVPLEFARKRLGAETLEDGARALYEAIRPHRGRAAVVTAGTAGSCAWTAAGAMRQPAYRVKVVDTTGCGDVFHGAFALGVARGESLERIMPFAAAAAALKCRQPGGRAGIPTRGEVEVFLASGPPVIE